MLSGEQRLCVAVLARTLRDALYPVASARRAKFPNREAILDARYWLFDEPESSAGAYSFVAVCQALDYNPAAVRERLRYLWLHERDRLNEVVQYLENRQCCHQIENSPQSNLIPTNIDITSMANTGLASPASLEGLDLAMSSRAS